MIVDKTANALEWILVMTLSSAEWLLYLWLQTFTVKWNCRFHSRMSLMKQENLLVLCRLDPWVHVVWLFPVTDQQVHAEHCCCSLNAVALELWAKLPPVVTEHRLFLKEQLTDKLRSFQLVCSADIFSKMKEVALVTSRKTTDNINCNNIDKLWIFKWELGFHHTRLCCRELAGPPMLRDFSDAIRGPTNKRDILVLSEETYQHSEELQDSAKWQLPNGECTMF